MKMWGIYEHLISFVIVNNRREILEIQTDAGMIISGVIWNQGLEIRKTFLIKK